VYQDPAITDSRIFSVGMNTPRSQTNCR
jgi:hypothetical protein